MKARGNIELQEAIRRFLEKELGIKQEQIDEIGICRMMDGQLRNITISFIPNIKGDFND